MKKLLILLILLITSPALAQQCSEPVEVARMGLPTISGSVPVGGTWIPKDDADCVGAFYMNGDETEVDRSGRGGDLVEAVGEEIPLSATVPSGYSGSSRYWNDHNLNMFITDGSEGALDINGNPINMTVCAWVRPALQATMSIVYKENYQYQLVLVWTTSLYATFQISSNGSSWTVATGTTDLSVNTWYHVCGIYDDTLANGNVQVWVGTEGSATALETDEDNNGGISNAGTNFSIGTRSDNAQDMRGYIDEVIVFDRVLTSEEINLIRTNGISGDKGASDS